MELKRYTALIWRWAWLILLGVVISGGTAFLVSSNITPIYSTSSLLLIDEAPGSGGGNEYSQVLLEQRLTQTYVQILNTRPVLEETIVRLELPFSPERLQGMVSVSSQPDTQIIVITVQDTNPSRAADIANMMGEVFIAFNQERESLRYAEPITNGEARLGEIGAEIQQLEIEIDNSGDPETAVQRAELGSLEVQLNEAQLRYTDAFNALNALQLDQAKESSNVVPIEQAKPPRSPIRPRISTNTILAALTGGMLALGIILLIDFLDDTVKTPEHVLEDTNLATLAAIAYIKGDEPSDRLIAHHRPRDPISEAYRVMRTNLNFSAVDGDLRTVLVTSSSPSEGKSTTTANLATVLAQTGKKTIIVDADLRRPTQHKIFNVPNNQGLTTAILDSQSPITYHIQNSKIPGLRIMASGPIPPNPSELLNSQRMTAILDALKDEADVVIFDTPPALTVADSTILASKVDGSIVVAYAGQTKREMLTDAVERLAKASGNIFGVVLNRQKPGGDGYYQKYYYYQYYSKTYEQETKSQSRIPGWITGLTRRS